MKLPMEPPYAPMEAETAADLPDGEGWQYEPKWDGFRCLVFRDGADVELQSKSCKPLTRYFPEVADAVRALRPRQFVIDGELVIPSDEGLSFDALLQRIHPAESRVQKLAAETPAWLILFDILATGPRTAWVDSPLERRRQELESWAERYLESGGSIQVSPATREHALAEEWLGSLTGVDGVVAKRLSATYASGERKGMVKVKRLRTADCVVGGFRYASSGRALGSLLLGLYDDEGRLDHVGFTSSFTSDQRRSLLAKVEALVEPPGFTGSAPGGPSRWSRGRDRKWQPLRPELVVEVQYDHFTSGRFRHGTNLLRWRPDKDPRQCTYAQLRRVSSGGIALLED